MPYKFLVPGCKSNYKNVSKTKGNIQLVQFPKDSSYLDNWVPVRYKYIAKQKSYKLISEEFYDVFLRKVNYQTYWAEIGIHTTYRYLLFC